MPSFVLYRAKHINIFLHRTVNCHNVWSLLILFGTAYWRRICWFLYLRSRACMTSWLLYPLHLRFFLFRGMISVPRLSSSHMVLAHWMSVFSTTSFCDRWCSDFAWRQRFTCVGFLQTVFSSKPFSFLLTKATKNNNTLFCPASFHNELDARVDAVKMLKVTLKIFFFMCRCKECVVYIYIPFWQLLGWPA